MTTHEATDLGTTIGVVLIAILQQIFNWRATQAHADLSKKIDNVASVADQTHHAIVNGAERALEINVKGS